jgi:small nuclear ribonucleoprotein (snRNP)-like protein
MNSIGESSTTEQNGTNKHVNDREISKWLGRTLRVDLVDGRSIVGLLMCTDNEPNFILNHAEETWGPPATATHRRHQIGSVLINAKNVQRIYETPSLNSRF